LAKAHAISQIYPAAKAAGNSLLTQHLLPEKKDYSPELFG